MLFYYFSIRVGRLQSAPQKGDRTMTGQVKYEKQSNLKTHDSKNKQAGKLIVKPIKQSF